MNIQSGINRMANSTALHSNAFNFMSFLQNQVDPRTGQYTCSIALPELNANNLAGPVVPLQLGFSPLNNVDSGFGKGWNLQLSQFDPASRILSLYTGETFQVNFPSTGEGVVPEKKIDSFHAHKLDTNTYQIDHKSGLVEILKVVQGGLALPVEMRSPQGHSVTLHYESFNVTFPLLSHIANADGTLLLHLTRTGGVLKLVLHPDSRFAAVFTLNIRSELTESIVLPTADKASWRFSYRTLEGLSCLESVATPAGGQETVTYADVPHAFPGLDQRKLPRVAVHKRNPGFGQAIIETRFEYDAKGNNFLGNGSGLRWGDDGLDNLYKVTSDYTYETTEKRWDAVANKAARTTRRLFNRFHLLTLEEVAQPASDTAKGDALQVTETLYPLVAGASFKDQKNYCQLPGTVIQRWYFSQAVTLKHEERVTTTYDDFGNVLTEVAANGIKETNEWYRAEGEIGCPADPQGFVRQLKSKTVTPASARYGKAAALTTRYDYGSFRGLNTTDPAWLAVVSETLAEATRDVQKSTFSYFVAPNDNSLLHGRKRDEQLSVNGQVTRTEYAYSTTEYLARQFDPADPGTSTVDTAHLYAGDTVLNTVSTLIGFDDREAAPIRKVITLQHSLLNGEPLLNRDDNDVEIAYEYDLLGRVIKETVAPGTRYAASRSYSYTLTNAANQQASQQAIDVKGVETISLLDGHNRVIEETRRDADGLGGDDKKQRKVYSASYDIFEQLATEVVIDWEGSKDVPLSSTYHYDHWGQQSSVTQPDGIEAYEVTDPIARTTTQWLQGKLAATGKTVVYNNVFDKPDKVLRFDLAYTKYSEHAYHYDGLGRTAEEINAIGDWTRYEYDMFDRMIKTILPDSNEVVREYAGHSSEDLPVKITAAGKLLGEQVFDGLDRMTQSNTGGRISRYDFKPGLRQPSSVTRPSDEVTTYQYQPALGEDPELRSATGTEAQYVYDPQSARLLGTQEDDDQGYTHQLTREYFSTGELKSEQRRKIDQATGVAADEDTFVMHYVYSRQARLMRYTDVLGNVQTYAYDTYARLTSTELGTTRSAFTYDSLGQTRGIKTIDGAQCLKIDLEYDDYGREVLRTFDVEKGNKQTLEQFYDEVDRLTRRTLKEGGNVLRDETYEYDNRGRLVIYGCTGSQPPVDPYGKPIGSQMFVFDGIDNIEFVLTGFAGGVHGHLHEARKTKEINVFMAALSSELRAGTYTSQAEENVSVYEYANDDPCQLTRVTNDHGDYPPLLEFIYDANGNLLQDEAGRQLSYDSLGRLSSVSAGPDGGGSRYGYDPLDTLSHQRGDAGEEQRFYQEGALVSQVQGDSQRTFVRANGSVVAEHKDGADPKSLLLAADNKHSVLSTVSQERVAQVAYTPYGHQPGAGEAGSDLGYNGERREAQTGWYLLGNGYRAYSPALMRFHSPDNLSPFAEGGVNAYAYCQGDPIGFSDPTGHFSFKWLGKLFGRSSTKAGKQAKNTVVSASPGISAAPSRPLVKSSVNNKIGPRAHKNDVNWQTRAAQLRAQQPVDLPYRPAYAKAKTYEAGAIEASPNKNYPFRYVEGAAPAAPRGSELAHVNKKIRSLERIEKKRELFGKESDALQALRLQQDELMRRQALVRS
ncbi:RHS repeat domain-containing protein [Pseudomonas fontis]|uniref:RHS repeat-associated core domain-containing protein n=1 Tax=Pseudomonas fontis TaxID=2942633 RepID=A0ABT5NTJ3_9PSED|nr:RHS repeat-associated core domain-containing protein [Pseudomonas fontis]MDD0976858.1 RHS repeat-associated core domain-containing protein [Pseudomonas fontis]MDD0991493.1 RHS repeat-associated core domain-containing protein [Pseudomonas fontis]